MSIERMAKKYWLRLNIVIGYPIVWVLDGLVALTTDHSWLEERTESDKAASEAWNKYA